MAEEIKDLIEKIQTEGVNVAKEKAKQIETQASKQAEEIIKKAKNEAVKIITEAEDKIHKLEQASKKSLSHAGRDLLISLKKEINALLDKIMVLAIRQTLTHLELTKILHSLVTDTAKQNKNNITILVNKDDLEKLNKTFLAELKEELKKGITLKAKEDISAGFLISYDAEKSYFDFTDKALAEYLSQHLKPELAKLLKE